MTHDDLIEAMALAIGRADETAAPDGTLDHPETSDWSEHLARSTLAALCDVIYGLSDVIDGKATIVPLIPLGGAVDAGAKYLRDEGWAIRSYDIVRGVYATMLAASPYRREGNDH